MLKTILLVLMLSVEQAPVAKPDVPAHLQNISVTIKSNRGEGSGVIKTRGDTNYIWTVGHVVEANRKVKKVIDSRTGSERYVIEFDDLTVIKELYENGRSVGKVEVLAEVVRYSDAEEGDDLVLLRVRKKGFVLKESVSFHDHKVIPPVGSRLWHCGSLLGQGGSNSVTTGLLSQVGRVFNNRVFDQTSCSAFPGSSGGGVYTEGGECVGILVRGAGENFNLIVPVRRLHEWAEKVGVLFAVDDSVAVPDDKSLKAKPIEDAPSLPTGTTERSAAKPSVFKTMEIKSGQ